MILLDSSYLAVYSYTLGCADIWSVFIGSFIQSEFFRVEQYPR